MSAICGILRFDGGPVDPRDLDRMDSALKAFGPDDGATVTFDAIGFGHRQLRVNREDRFEAQPIHDREARLTIVADLRLDNRDALIDALGLDPAACRDWPDSAFLAPAYRRWGEKLPEHLLGDFALAIWDADARNLMLACDHMCQRGLHYHRGEHGLTFASTVEALCTLPGIERTISDAEFARALTRGAVEQRPAPDRTRITALPKATRLIVHADGRIEETVYWRPGADPKYLGKDEAYYLATYRAVLTEAVECRLRRLEGAPALFMSGAFDSGSIAALAGPVLTAQGRKLIAVSSVLEEGETRPQRQDARAAVEAFRPYPWIDVRYFTGGDRGLYDDPEAGFATYGLILASQPVQGELARIAATQGATLLMDGYGGDYTLHIRSPNLLGKLLRKGQLRRFVGEFRLRRRATGRTRIGLLRAEVFGALKPLWYQRLREAAWRGFRAPWTDFPIARDFARRLIREGGLDQSAMRFFGQRIRRWREQTAHILDVVAAAPQPGQLLAGKLGMAFTRPFHDKRVVELGMAIPDDLLFRNGLDRYLPRAALSDCLPERLLRYAGGNTTPNPDAFRTALERAPALLADMRALDGDGRVSAYIDLDRIEADLKNPDENDRRDHQRLHLAVQAMMMTRYKLWIDRTNT
jgi:asparagine synthase (glutamine-hydrolysing)